MTFTPHPIITYIAEDFKIQHPPTDMANIDLSRSTTFDTEENASIIDEPENVSNTMEEAMIQLVPQRLEEENFSKVVNFLTTIVGPEHKTDGNKYFKFRYKDALWGERNMISYFHDDSYVLTSWEDQRESIAYTKDFELYKKQCMKYLTDNIAFHEEPATRAWLHVEAVLNDFVKNFGVIALTGKMLKTPALDDQTKIKLLSYLQLDDCIQKAKELELKFEMLKETDKCS